MIKISGMPLPRSSCQVAASSQRTTTKTPPAKDSSSGRRRLPLATTMQFRNTVKIILGSRVGGFSYTDKASRNAQDTDPKRHLGLFVNSPTSHDVENIEFLLWMQGVTAHTRLGQGWCGLVRSGMVRGTCIIVNPRKSSMKSTTY